MIEAHKARSHSRIGPSAMHRIVACPGSVSASAHVAASASSVFALEGTAAHELCEFVMNQSIDPQDYLGGLIDLGDDDDDPLDLPFTPIAKRDPRNPLPDSARYWRIDEEMVEAVELYRDTINAYVEPDDIVEFETRLDMSHVHPDCYGTGDALIFKPAAQHLIVGDFKYGSGLVVEVKDNEQLWTYALGAVRRFHNYGVETITLVVVQPRAFHRDGPVRTQTITLGQLASFEGWLRGVLALAASGLAPFAAGDHCRFCPVAYDCGALRDFVFKTLGVKFLSTIDDSAMPNLKRMTPAEMGRVYRQVQVIEAWLRRFLEHAHKEAVNGNQPEGTKLVQKRAYRYFNDPLEVEARLDLLGFGEDETHTEPELKSAAKIEAIVGKKTFKTEFGDVVTKRSSGVVLALIEDDREAVKMDSSDAFGAVDEDDEVIQ